MKIIKLTSALIITFLFLIRCSSGYVTGNYKISLLLGQTENRHMSKQIINKTIETQLKRLEFYGIRKENIKSEIKGNNIFIEVDKINNPERVEKILTQQGKIEFWETYDFQDVYEYFYKANTRLREIKLPEKNKTVSNKKTDKDLLKDNSNLESNNINTTNSAEKEGFKEFQKQNPLFSLLIPYVDKNNQPIKSAVIGYSDSKDTSEINEIFKMPQIKSIFPRKMVLLWEYKPMDMPVNEYGNEAEIKENKYYRLIALKAERIGKPSLEGDVITNASAQISSNIGQWEISMSMNEEASLKWAIITKNNIGKQIAIVIDGYVYSAPNVNAEIKGGTSAISGNFTQEEATDFALMFKTKSLPYKLKILEKDIKK